MIYTESNSEYKKSDWYQKIKLKVDPKFNTNSLKLTVLQVVPVNHFRFRHSLSETEKAVEKLNELYHVVYV